jgi:hypothetical protein
LRCYIDTYDGRNQNRGIGISICDALHEVKYATLHDMIAAGDDLSTPVGYSIDQYQTYSLTLLHELTHALPSPCKHFLSMLENELS